MYKIVASNRFKKDLKTAIRRGFDIQRMDALVTKLAAGEQLDAKYWDHPLVADYKGFRECHITPDWLLIYRYENDELILFLARNGTHSDLF